MAYPDDKETFRRVVDQDLTQGIPGNTVLANDHNYPVDFLERLQDILGYTLLLGYSTVKALLVYLKGEADKVVNKRDLTDVTFSTKIIANGYIATNQITPTSGNTVSFPEPFGRIYCSQSNLYNLVRVGLTSSASGLPDITWLSGDKIKYDGNEHRFDTGDILVNTIGKGTVIRSPNGTKYRVKISDAGALSTELA